MTRTFGRSPPISGGRRRATRRSPARARHRKARRRSPDARSCLRPVDRGGRRAELQRDAIVRIPFLRSQPQPVEAHCARHVGLRQGRALIGQLVFAADQRDLHVRVELAQFRRGGHAGMASTDDDRVRHWSSDCPAKTGVAKAEKHGGVALSMRLARCFNRFVNSRNRFRGMSAQVIQIRGISSAKP
jgi:hypothetical protein